MSKKSGKKVVSTTNRPKRVVPTQTKSKKDASSTLSKFRKGAAAAAMPKEEMMFEKQNYMLMGLSMLVIIVGFMLMSGGAMPSPDVWDDNLIYSFRRITLAPFVVLVGLGIMIVAIFKK